MYFKQTSHCNRLNLLNPKTVEGSAETTMPLFSLIILKLQMCYLY